MPARLDADAVYHWRCRGSDDNNWINASFHIGDRFGWRHGNNMQFQANTLDHAVLNTDGIQLLDNDTIFKIESSGYDDLNYAIIFVNSVPVATAKRGHNIAVCDSYGVFIEFGNFDTHTSTEDADAMAQFIDGAPEGAYVLAGIRDTGEQSMTEAAYLALESIGSRYCREVGFRDSWAIIGRKGADIGTVPERHVPRYGGVAIVSDTLNMVHASGTVLSPAIGPTTAWHSLQWDQHVPAEAEPVRMSVIGFNNTASTWDTLKTGLGENTGESLEDISAADYPLLRLMAELRTNDPFVSPELRDWSVYYDPVGDAALGAEVVRVSSDTVFEGGAIDIEVEVHNAGAADMDSLLLRFSELNPVSGTAVFADKRLPRLRAGQHADVSVTWDSRGKGGTNQIIIEADPENRIPELSEDNNFHSTRVIVKADTMRPHISATFDGIEIYDDALVSRSPVIDIRITDNSPVKIQDDTTRVHLMLDGERVPFLNNGDMLAFMPLSGNGFSDLSAMLRYTPQLDDGDHMLQLYVRDAGDNLTWENYLFRVVSDLQLREVLNYPNPFHRNTNFTYFLTQPADNVTIKVYTVAGRLILEMDGCPGSAGFNQLAWDGRDGDGDRLANGVYFYKIIARAAGKQTEALEKLVVMR
jgi:hypothetical protein